MVALAKLEKKQAELKVENGRLKQNGYVRKYHAKQKKLKRMIANASQEQAELKAEKNGYWRKWDAKNKMFKRMLANANQEQAARKVENKRLRTESSQPLARETAASRRTGIRSIIFQMD